MHSKRQILIYSYSLASSVALWILLTWMLFCIFLLGLTLFCVGFTEVDLFCIVLFSAVLSSQDLNEGDSVVHRSLQSDVFQCGSYVGGFFSAAISSL